jgi:hypothetical protein
MVMVSSAIGSRVIARMARLPLGLETLEKVAELSVADGDLLSVRLRLRARARVRLVGLGS